MSGKLEGKVAVITGGSSGIGLATAKRFTGEGATVVITGRRQAELGAAVKQIGGSAIGVRGDVAKLADLDRLYATVKEKYGRVDVLFANAGTREFARLGEVTEDHYERTFDANVKGLLFTVQKALPLMPDGGSIILNASITGSKGLGNVSVYSATKAAVRSFARTWTPDLKARKIRVNALSPGITDTPAQAGVSAAVQAGRLAAVPMGRMGHADEIARAAVFLASDDSSYVTGVELFVDGGMAQV